MNFLRKLRQRLLTENRFNKYLLYAVGEILLVVIGILLALQIDTWNEAKKQRQASRDFISRLQNEVRKNIGYAEAEISVEQRQVASAKAILALFNRSGNPGPGTSLDSLIYNSLGSSSSVNCSHKSFCNCKISSNRATSS